MKSSWKEIGSWNVGTSDGGREKYTLSEDQTTGDFRIKNDFGNITIDMERMSGYKFMKKIVRKMEDSMTPGDYANDDWVKYLGSNYDLDSNDDNDNDNNDCDYTD